MSRNSDPFNWLAKGERRDAPERNQNQDQQASERTSLHQPSREERARYPN